MLNSQQLQTLRTILRSLVAQCDVTYKVPHFDHDFYRACIDEAERGGYPVHGDPSVQTYLPDTFSFATLAFGHTDRGIQMWIALYAVGTFYIDDAPFRFPSAMPHIHLLNTRFIERQKQGDGLLNLYADYLRRAPSLFHPIPADLIITSNMNFVTGTLLEYETKSMQSCITSKLYPDYQRERSGIGEATAYYVFPRSIPPREYFQVIPDVMMFMNYLNDILSFYKEELTGDDANLVTVLASQSKKSKLEVLQEIVGKTVELHRGIVGMLEGSHDAFQAFKRFTEGYFIYHLTAERYKLADLDLFQ